MASRKDTFFLPLKPNATQRSRCACRGRYPSVYTAPKYKEWKAEALPILKQLAAERDFSEVHDFPVTVLVEVISDRPKTTKLYAPGGDNDNYEKGIFDIITKSKGWWKDDKQIVDNRTVKRWAEDDEEAGYRVTIEFIGDRPFSQ